MKLKDIELAATLKNIRDGHRVVFCEKNTPVYTAEQMQEYAKNMVYEALYKHTAFGTGKEELVKHMTNIFFQEKASQEVK